MRHDGPMSPSERPRRRIVIVAFDGVQPLDAVGPAEVFTAADNLQRPTGYSVELVSESGGEVGTISGLGLTTGRAASTRGPIDTLIVAGGGGVEDARSDDRLVAWIRRAASRTRRVSSVCTGAFLLAEAGLLDGRDATTHWSGTQKLAREFPSVRVLGDRIFVQDGHVWTSAGVTAGMDLALALVEEDLGRETALEVARWLVLYSKRPGGQAQFSASLELQRAVAEPLREVQDWIGENLDRDLAVDSLAERAGMSVRGFARAFRRETGVTPAAYVEGLRVERARLALESTEAPVETIARSCGFGTPETMRRAFGRRLRVSPSAYRTRFGRTTTHTAEEAPA